MSMVMKQCPAHRAVFLCSNANDRLCGGGGVLPGLLCALCFHRNKLLNVAEYVVGCIMNNHRNNLHALYTYTEYDFPYHYSRCVNL